MKLEVRSKEHEFGERSLKHLLKTFSNIEIEILLQKVLGKSKEFLYMNPEFSLSANQFIRLSAMVKRRQKGEPMAYILGYKDFCGLRFKVNKNVLVPRPETEQLVEIVAGCIQDVSLRGAVNASEKGRGNLLAKRSPRPAAGWSCDDTRTETLRILDVGTGSGCIIVSLAKQLSGKSAKQTYKFYGSDVSAQALTVAKRNAKSHGVKGLFLQSNLLNTIKKDFDIIIANLPYGWTEWKNNSSAETIGLKFEPKTALFTKEQGLYEIRRLLEQIARRKHQPQKVFLEFDPRQKPELQRLIKQVLPAWDTIFYKDLHSRWRFVEIRQM